MSNIIKAEIQNVLEEAISMLAHLSIPVDNDNTDRDVLFALNYCHDNLIKDIEYSPKALSLVDAVIDKTWQKLNTGCWKDVPLYFRELYAYAGFLKALMQLKYTSQGIAGKLETNLKNVLETIDRALLLGSSCREELSHTATSLCQILNKVLDGLPKSSFSTFDQNKCTNSPGFTLTNVKPVISLHRPSIEYFSREHFVTHIPAKLTGCIEHWPALKKWQNVNYIFEKIGPRLVPIEIGSSYTSSSWSQKLITVRSFIENYVLPENPEQIGYLAQHQLFNQIPELLLDIREPEYCSFSESHEEDESIGVDVNAWFGPANTLSPFHYDPKHNFLAQVVGCKRVLLVDPVWSDNLYPYDDRLLFNTAQVDPENLDYNKFPKFSEVECFECILEPGDMLYIPPKWWHHVRSLSASFSVSFWWGKTES